MQQKLKEIARTLRQYLAFYTALYQDPRTPRLARLFLWAALAYVAMPFDVIPDFLPLIGHLDDVIIVPGLIFLAVRLIPVVVYDEHWNKMFGQSYKRSIDRTAQANTHATASSRLCSY